MILVETKTSSMWDQDLGWQGFQKGTRSYLWRLTPLLCKVLILRTWRIGSSLSSSRLLLWRAFTAPRVSCCIGECQCLCVKKWRSNTRCAPKLIHEQPCRVEWIESRGCALPTMVCIITEIHLFITFTIKYPLYASQSLCHRHLCSWK